MTERERVKRREERKKPLTPVEEKFIAEYIKCGNASEAARNAGYRGDGNKLLSQLNVQKRIRKIMKQLEKDTTATAQEVMEFFTAVMRGEVADQFGLDASIADRTRAAQELAKRTVDIENREKGKADTSVSINVNWKRD